VVKDFCFKNLRSKDLCQKDLWSKVKEWQRQILESS
jgi:hypothetical protein